MKSNTLKNANFILIVIGQIISLLGNGIIRFTLPLYLLQITNSAATFGIVNAISFIPLIIIMPIGGIVADRVNKKNIMIILDFFTSILLFIFTILIDKIEIIPLIILTMMILYCIQGIYQPAVQASIPFILDDNILIKGNSIVNGVSNISNLLSPIISGFLFGNIDIKKIVIISSICFFISAILELFIKMPYHQQNIQKQSIIKILENDTTITLNYIFKQNTKLSKLILITCILNTFISSLIMIALPILITKNLNFSSQMYGIATSMLALGGLIGSIFTIALKIEFKNLKQCFSILTLSLIPLFIAPFLINIKLLSFYLILCSTFFVMCIATIISILIMTYIQNNAPEDIVGKIISFLFTLSIFSQPIGQFLYGLAFEYAKNYESFIILISIFISIFIKNYIKKIF